MGRIRGKRNRDQDRYWHERRKATQAGLTAAALEASAVCLKCATLTARDQMHKGWCLSCVAKWIDITDPWLLYQAQSQLPTRVVPRSTIKRVEELRSRIVEPVSDDSFLPLTQFFGSRGVGHQKTMWNFLQAMYTFELRTTGEAHKLGTVCPNTVHLCGRHAPVQRSGIEGYLSRIQSTKGDFKLFAMDKHFVDYVRGFAADNRLVISTYRKTSIDVHDRAASMRFVAKYGKTHFDKHQPAYWPFESAHEGKLREKGEMEELPDVVMEIGKLIPTASMPESLREDLCQDLVVAVLTCEITIEELRIENRMRYYIREAFKHHPLKYGRFSLDHPSPQYAFKGEDYMQSRDLVTHEDVSPERADRGWLAALCVDPSEERHGWHEGHDRPRGLASLGDVARHNNDGHAIQGPDVIRTSEEIDEDIAEVFYADQHPSWRRKLSG
jgi:hypothetical protein